MSKVVILGLPNEDGLWMVDLDQKTVAAMPAHYADRLAANGAVVSGVDFAVAIGGQTPVLAGKFDTVSMPLSK
nr:hypothetical protein [uncultured Gellertiella sp.]